MRKAQIQSQVIVYILAVVIMGMILIFGFKAIMDMKDRARMAQLIQFRKDISSDIISVGVDYGTSKLKTYRVPPEFRQVCFVNLEHTSPSGDSDVVELVKATKASALVKNAVESIVEQGAARKNLFLCPPCSEQENVGNINILDENDEDTAFRCFNVSQGALSLRITGLGDMAQISSAQIN